MPNQELPKFIIKPDLTPEQVKTVMDLRQKLGEKIAKIDDALRDREAKLNSGLRKDEKVVIEEDFNRLEAQKQTLVGQMPEVPVMNADKPLILDQYSLPLNKEYTMPVTLYDPYNNPLPPSSELPPVVTPPPVKSIRQIPIQTQTPAPVQGPVAAPTIVQPPVQPVVQGPINPVIAPAQKINQVAPQPVVNPGNNAPINTAPTQNINNAPTPVVAPVAPVGPTGPAVTPVAPVQTKSPERLLAEKIRREEPLTREELLLRRDRFYGAGGIEEEIMKIHAEEKAANPQPVEVTTTIEHGGPNLERARNDYVLALFQNRNSYYPDVATFAHLKVLKDAYNKKVEEGIQEIQPIGDMLEDNLACTRLRVKFYAAEREAFQREILRLESEETKKRIKDTISKALDKTGKFFGKAKEKLDKGMEKVGNFFTDDPNTKGMGWLYYLVIAQAAPLIIGAKTGINKVADAADNGLDTLRKKFRDALSSKTPKTESPDKAKTLGEKYGDKKGQTHEKVVPEPKESADALEVKRKKEEVETRKKEFIEKVTGVELKGRDLDAWIKSKAVYTGKFFNPSRFKTAKTVDDYPPFQRKIHDALLPEYEKLKNDKTKDIKATNKLNLEEFITKLAEQDKLKDLWKTT